MIISYKIEGRPVEKRTFQGMLKSLSAYTAWEKVIEDHRQEIETSNAAIIFKIIDRKFYVLTETSLLFKLSSEVKNYLRSSQSKSFAINS